MATLCISSLSFGDIERRNRLVTLANGLAGSGKTIALLLYGDGVYNLVDGSQSSAQLASAPLEIYVIAEDIENRGLAGRIIPQAQQIDYARAAELIMESEHTITGV